MDVQIWLEVSIPLHVIKIENHVIFQTFSHVCKLTFIAIFNVKVLMQVM